MNKITDYVILSAFNPNDLSIKVKEFIEKDWQPFGDHRTIFGKVELDRNSGAKNIMNEAVLFTQAMAKYYIADSH